MGISRQFLGLCLLLTTLSTAQAEGTPRQDSSTTTQEPAISGEKAGYDIVVVPDVKTSIYVGKVTLVLSKLERTTGTSTYKATYKAKVVPYFFYNEGGHFEIEFTDEQLDQLERGERVYFKGEAKNTGGKDRRIEGHASPPGPNSKTGKIKVRVFVTKSIELIFNTTYTFSGKDTSPEAGEK